MDKLFGYSGKDIITGFKGTIIGRCSYITGCDQLLLSPKSNDGKPADARWFDAQRVEVTSKKPVVKIDNGTTPGCDIPAPVR